MAYEKYKLSGYLVINLFKEYFKTNLSADELAKKISSSPYIIGQLGYYYEISLGDTDRLENAMQDLASRSTAIPNSESFFNAMKAEADSRFIYVVKYASQKVAEDSFEAAKNVGSITLTGLKILPWLVLGVVLFYGKKVMDRKSSEI